MKEKTKKTNTAAESSNLSSSSSSALDMSFTQDPTSLSRTRDNSGGFFIHQRFAASVTGTLKHVKSSVARSGGIVTSLLLVRMSPNTVCVRACALVLAVVTCPFVITAYSREHE